VADITQGLVRGLFLHEPFTGWLIRRKRTAHGTNRGDIVGCPNTQGHLQVRIHSVRYYVHQLVWLYHYGFIPKLIDHINQDPSDNRIENLRIADKSLNAINTGLPSHNTSGYKGVWFCNTKKRWIATIERNGIRKKLGQFKHIQGAINARIKAE